MRPCPESSESQFTKPVDEDEDVVAHAPEPGQPAGVLGDDVEDVPVEDPRSLAVQFEDNLVDQVEVPEVLLGELPEHVVVVARDVVDRHARRPPA